MRNVFLAEGTTRKAVVSCNVSDSAANGITLTPYDPKLDVQMQEARAIMKKRRNVLRELAK